MIVLCASVSLSCWTVAPSSGGLAKYSCWSIRDKTANFEKNHENFDKTQVYSQYVHFVSPRKIYPTSDTSNYNQASERKISDCSVVAS